MAIRLVFINSVATFTLDSTSHKFWYDEFKKQASAFLFINGLGWDINKIKRFCPDHIHFGGDLLPRAAGMPIQKIMLLKKACPKAVLTSYRGGPKEIAYLEKLNPLMDAAFGSTDSIRGQTWMPAPADPKFWAGERYVPSLRKLVYIGHASKRHIKTANKRGIAFTKHKYLKAVSSKFPITIVGSGWKQFSLTHLSPTLGYWQNKNYYLTSQAGLNICHDHFRRFKKYWSSRLMHMLMSGLPSFTHYQPDIDKVLITGRHCIIYRDEKDLLEQLGFWLRPCMRKRLEQIGKQGQEYAARYWSAQTAVRKILAVRKK